MEASEANSIAQNKSSKEALLKHLFTRIDASAKSGYFSLYSYNDQTLDLFDSQTIFNALVEIRSKGYLVILTDGVTYKEFFGQPTEIGMRDFKIDWRKGRTADYYLSQNHEVGSIVSPKRDPWYKILSDIILLKR